MKNTAKINKERVIAKLNLSFANPGNSKCINSALNNKIIKVIMNPESNSPRNRLLKDSLILYLVLFSSDEYSEFTIPFKESNPNNINKLSGMVDSDKNTSAWSDTPSFEATNKFLKTSIALRAIEIRNNLENVLKRLFN